MPSRPRPARAPTALLLAAMGVIRNSKADKLAEQARTAYANGQFFFAAMLNSPWSSLGFSGEIADWSAMIEAVEREGWVLAHWAGSSDNKGNPQAYPVFRRR